MKAHWKHKQLIFSLKKTFFRSTRLAMLYASTQLMCVNGLKVASCFQMPPSPQEIEYGTISGVIGLNR